MDQSWPYICGIGVSIIAVAITVLGRLVKTFRHDQQVGNLCGVDILQVLSQAKVFPVTNGSVWKLHKFSHDTRIWQGQVTSDRLIRPILVFGCYSKVKGSSQVVLNILKDINKHMDWQPGLHQVKQITRTKETAVSKNKNSPSLPVQHDYVSFETETERCFWLISFINSVSERLQGEPLIRKVSHVNRYWHREDNGCCWILESTLGTGEWTFYLAQPVEGWFEMDQCLLTIVQSPSVVRGKSAAVDVACRLAAIQNYLLYRKVQCTPLITLSLPLADGKDWKAEDDQGVQQTLPKKVDEVENKAKIEEPASGKTETNLLQKFCNLIEEKKEWYEEQKRMKNASSSVSGAGNSSQSKDVTTSLPATTPVKGEESEESDTESPELYSITKDSTEQYRSPEIDKPKIERKSILKFLRSASVSSVSGEMDRKTSDDEDGSVQVRSGLAVNLMRKIRSFDRLGKQMPTPSGEEVELDSEEEKMAVGFRTVANAVAAEIMAEKVKVSNIDISQSYDTQALQTDGWIYCGLEKDVVILRKIFEDGTPLQSYLGKGLIPVPPKTVFEALKNPRTRFTYDEMLKKVDILQDFGGGLKVVYLYHEVSQLFRKEARDFCILQSERIEGVKYVISMVSIDWPACHKTEDVTRGKFQSSGWIIEPTTRDNKLYAMVTYIVQMDLRSSKSNTGYLIEELAAKQPLSIAYLRQYLLPAAGVARLSSSETEKKHSSQTSPISTLAAAAAFASHQQLKKSPSSPS